MIKIYVSFTNIDKMKTKCLEGWLCTENKKRLWVCVLLLLEICPLEHKELSSGGGERRAFAVSRCEGFPSTPPTCLLLLRNYFCPTETRESDSKVYAHSMPS